MDLERKKNILFSIRFESAGGVDDKSFVIDFEKLLFDQWGQNLGCQVRTNFF